MTKISLYSYKTACSTENTPISQGALLYKIAKESKIKIIDLVR